MRRQILFSLIIAALGYLTPPLSAVQYGFADSGFQIASIRTVYDDGYEGTSLNPLSLSSPCLWDASTALGGCPTGPTIYSASNWWRQNWVDYCGALIPCKFWLLQMNNEPAFNNCNPGPPDASLPRSEPGHGIMGFTAIKGSLVGETFYRAHLVLNLTYPNPCDGGYGTPFLSIAADRDRGNAGLTPGALNRSSSTIPNRVKFTARLWDMGLPSCPACTNPNVFVQPGKGYLDFALWAVAEWGGKQRMLFVNLLHRNVEYTGGKSGDKWEFNWPVREDILYPGADLAFFEAEALPALCNYTVPVMSGALGQEINYTIDLQKLFKCASDQGLFKDPMPTTANLPIKTVGWKNEGKGLSNGIWTSVHGMNMVP
jgi:hypothetical protein